ncbi:MAG: hypothetical protein APF80_04495 [Alphaproteobacteria bacterium BRH_c36]|nr:MAG: hypothetical protein APF80_04495 [Alphaproteobacteria bacterium BRH_c36]
MLDFDTQARFNQSCTKAVVNYLNASGAAYQAMADQMLRVWGQSIDAFVENAKPPRSSSPMQIFQPGHTGQSGGLDCMMPWAAVPNAIMRANPLASLTPFGTGSGYGIFSPMAPWMEMMMPRNATAWPMAVGMISFGVPEQVAWPTARGNAAAMDAYSVAAKSVEKALTAFGAAAKADRAPAVSRIEAQAPDPFSVTFAIMPFQPAMLMEFFKPFRPR